MGFDLDAFIAEAAGDPFTFTFAGEEYTLPPQPDIRVAALFDQGQFGEALRRMLGTEQFATMFAGEGLLTREGMLEVIRRHAMHAGASLGESSASTGSSVSTGRPSKRTSSRTIRSA